MAKSKSSKAKKFKSANEAVARIDDHFIPAIYAIQGLIAGAHVLAEAVMERTEDSACLDVGHCLTAADEKLAALAEQLQEYERELGQEVGRLIVKGAKELSHG